MNSVYFAYIVKNSLFNSLFKMNEKSIYAHGYFLSFFPAKLDQIVSFSKGVNSRKRWHLFAYIDEKIPAILHQIRSMYYPRATAQELSRKGTFMSYWISARGTANLLKSTILNRSILRKTISSFSCRISTQPSARYPLSAGFTYQKE